MADDPFDLTRFVTAQDAPPPGCGGHEDACRELRAGRKRGHWIWWILPQLRGLGSSWRSTHYGIGSLAEAQAYLAHPVLGARLRTVTDLLLAADGDARSVLGHPDDDKTCSSMTLFSLAVPDEPGFRAVLHRWYDGVPDAATVRMIRER